MNWSDNDDHLSGPEVWPETRVSRSERVAAIGMWLVILTAVGYLVLHILESAQGG